MIRNGCNILKNDGRQWHNIRVAGFTGGSLQYKEWAVVYGNMRSTEGAVGDAADPDGTKDGIQQRKTSILNHELARVAKGGTMVLDLNYKNLGH